MTRYAFKMKLKPGCIEEYKRRHDTIWPELAALLKKSGIGDYSIFFDEETNSLFAVQKQEGPPRRRTSGPSTSSAAGGTHGGHHGHEPRPVAREHPAEGSLPARLGSTPMTPRKSRSSRLRAQAPAFRTGCRCSSTCAAASRTHSGRSSASAPTTPCPTTRTSRTGSPRMPSAPRMGSDCIVVGGTVRAGFVPAPVGGGVTTQRVRHAHVADTAVRRGGEVPAGGGAVGGRHRGLPVPRSARARPLRRGARATSTASAGSIFVIGDVELSLFELAWHLAGMEKYLMGMAMEEEWVDGAGRAGGAMDHAARPPAWWRRAWMRCGSARTWEARPRC